LRLSPALIAAASPGVNDAGSTTSHHLDGVFATYSPRAGHTGAVLAGTLSLFCFASVARRPRFSHDPVNLAPEYDG
jgi:hypothetical protein